MVTRKSGLANRYITQRAFNLLKRIAESEDVDEAGDGGGLVYCRGGGWVVGYHYTRKRIVDELLRYALISEDSHGHDDYRLHFLNSEGRHVLADYEYMPAMLLVAAGCPACKSERVNFICDHIECLDCEHGVPEEQRRKPRRRGRKRR